jgi:hypothetical protein
MPAVDAMCSLGRCICSTRTICYRKRDLAKVGKRRGTNGFGSIVSALTFCAPAVFGAMHRNRAGLAAHPLGFSAN